MADGSLPGSGKRLLAGVSFLFDAKKEAKKRHRFEAVDADQGCGPGPGECGHLTTAYSGPGGPEQGMDFNGVASRFIIKKKERGWVGV